MLEFNFLENNCKLYVQDRRYAKYLLAFSASCSNTLIILNINCTHEKEKEIILLNENKIRQNYQ